MWSARKMIRLSVIILLLVWKTAEPFAIGRDSPDLSLKPQLSAIIGGVTAPPHLYGWMVSLQRNFTNHDGNDEWFHICGGSLITDRLVLTAAHCVFSREDKLGLPRLVIPKELKVVVGIKDLNSSYAIDHEMAVELITPHEGFDPADAQMANDIAIIRLKCSVTYLSSLLSIEKVDLPDSSDTSTPAMSEYLIMGWGLTAKRTDRNLNDPNTVDDKSLKLQVASSTLVDLMTCRNIWRGIVHVTDALICTDSSFTDVCQGDSGGPLVERYVLPEDTRWRHRILGVASFSSAGCGKLGQAAMFTSVVKHLHNFIKPAMDETRKISSTRAKKCKRMFEHMYTGKFKRLLNTFRRGRRMAMKNF